MGKTSLMPDDLGGVPQVDEPGACGDPCSVHLVACLGVPAQLRPQIEVKQLGKYRLPPRSAPDRGEGHRDKRLAAMSISCLALLVI